MKTMLTFLTLSALVAFALSATPVLPPAKEPFLTVFSVVRSNSDPAPGPALDLAPIRLRDDAQPSLPAASLPDPVSAAFSSSREEENNNDNPGAFNPPPAPGFGFSQSFRVLIAARPSPVGFPDRANFDPVPGANPFPGPEPDAPFTPALVARELTPEGACNTPDACGPGPDPTPSPEPSTLVLALAGLTLIAIGRRR